MLAGVIAERSVPSPLRQHRRGPRGWTTCLVSLLLITGCLPAEVETESTRTPAADTGELDTGGVAGEALPSDVETAEVADIVDGDTIEVVFPPDDRQTDVRLVGINAPESVRPDYPVECYGPESSERMADLLPVGSTVYLQRDASDEDRFGRLLRHVWIVDETTDDAYLVSEILVRGGFVDARFYPPDDLHADRLMEAEHAAQREVAGMWATCDG